jgi:hypothetical protein
MVRYWGTDITHAYARHNGKGWGNDMICLSLEHKLPPSQVQLTVELHLSGLIGTASHLDKQKIRIIGFIFQSRLRWQFEVRQCICV